MIIAVLVFVLCLNLSCEAKLIPFVVGAEFSDIKNFPHAVCLGVFDCGNPKGWKCGSSVLNQRILLTAAHCVNGCTTSLSRVVLMYGNAHTNYAQKMVSTKIKVHQNYTENLLFHDIALVKTPQSLRFGVNIRRVALLPMREAPYDEMSTVAGWGLVDEIKLVQTNQLKHITQRVLSSETCESIVNQKPVGIICAAGKDTNTYASEGDSGTALVVRTYIQIGIVSFKEPSVRHVVMYTDVGYFYDWIIKHAADLFC